MSTARNQTAQINIFIWIRSKITVCKTRSSRSDKSTDQAFASDVPSALRSVYICPLHVLTSQLKPLCFSNTFGDVVSQNRCVKWPSDLKSWSFPETLKNPWFPYRDPGEGCDLGACGDEDVLGVDDLLAAVGCYRRHLVLPAHPPKTVDMSHLQGMMSHSERRYPSFRFLLVRRDLNNDLKTERKMPDFVLFE